MTDFVKMYPFLFVEMVTCMLLFTLYSYICNQLYFSCHVGHSRIECSHLAFIMFTLMFLQS